MKKTVIIGIPLLMLSISTLSYGQEDPIKLTTPWGEPTHHIQSETKEAPSSEKTNEDYSNIRNALRQDAKCAPYIDEVSITQKDNYLIISGFVHCESVRLRIGTTAQKATHSRLRNKLIVNPKTKDPTHFSRKEDQDCS